MVAIQLVGTSGIRQACRAVHLRKASCGFSSMLKETVTHRAQGLLTKYRSHVARSVDVAVDENTKF